MLRKNSLRSRYIVSLLFIMVPILIFSFIMYASNYDLTYIFIDSLCKIIPSEPDSPEVEEFLVWLDKFSEMNGVKFTVTISADIALATDALKAYF